ncbi:MAG: radical SAM family heme chaperone HemW [Deltaproteobacteria bacterium]|nr:radical SAM family heme chaperone HemW [Deltaproteobacteria bacterium]
MTAPDRLNVPGLYIHVPFCLSKCDYCGFYSVTDQSKIPTFIECLLEEMKLYKNNFDGFDTVYIGGGTPSILNTKQLGIILDRVYKNFSIPEFSEITCEANPGDLSLNFLRSLRYIGVNRLNIGVQSIDNDLLSFLGRRHSASESIDALENSRRAGFKNIGLDLIYGIPGQNIKHWLQNLQNMLSFEPEHISCYELTIEPGTPFHRLYKNGDFSIQKEDILYKFFTETSEFMETSGYIHYEVSNFAKGIKLRARHNQKYWNHTPYLGIGPSAHSFLHNRRWWNHPLDNYLRLLKERASPVCETETLNLKQLRDEALYLGLRTREGIDLKDFSFRYNYDLLKEKKVTVDIFLKEGLLEVKDNFLFPTLRGLAVADSLYREL